MAKHVTTSSDLLDEMYEIRENYRALDKESEALKATWKEKEAELITLFHQQGVDMSRSDFATGSLKTETVAKVEDPARFKTWLLRFKHLELLQMRISNAVYRELMEDRQEEVPGLESFKKESILLRKRRD